MYSYMPLVSKLTRISDTSATIIDHIWITNLEQNTSNMLLHNDISDHIIIISQFNIVTQTKKNFLSAHTRIITETNIELFRKELANRYCKSVLESECPNES